MSGEIEREWLPPVGAVLCYALLMWRNNARHALMDGLRALRRYHRLWGIPAGLGLCYALFHVALTLFYYHVLPMEQRPAFGWKLTWALPPWPAQMSEAHTLGDRLGFFFADPRWKACRDAGLDGVEALAGLFNNVVTTFPFSAAAGVLLLLNWEDHHRTLGKALRKRFGRWGWAMHAGILACAISAVLSPFLLTPSLILINRYAPRVNVVGWASLIDWLSSLFAYLFGVAVQVYLILIVYTWLRGINWTRAHLMDMAIRRFSFVVKWAVVVMACSSALIDLPRLFALLFRFEDPLYLDRTLIYTDRIARPLLAMFLICFSTMQITLTFHSETLRKALSQHGQFLRRYWWQLFWFLVVAGVHVFGLALLDHTLRLGFGGDYTSAGMVWSFVHALIGAFLAAWLLAAWVSLYKRCETGSVKAPDWIPF
jgi:hypothetical protein